MNITSPAGELARVLVAEHELRARVDALGTEIALSYAGATEPVVAVGILKGSAIFLADLVRAMPIDVAIEFMAISAYGRPGPHSGIVRILKDLEADIGARDVLIVEDIVDTGLTLNYLRKTLLGRGPRSLRTVTLLDKLARRIVPVPIEHTGFAIPDLFAIGYGLDFQGHYRNLRDLLEVVDLARLAANPLALAGADVGRTR